MKTENKMSFGVAVAVLVAVAIISGAIWFTTRTENKTNYNPAMVAEYKSEFVTACMEEDASYSYCSCTYESLAKELGIDGLYDLSLEYVLGDEFSNSSKDALKKAIGDCLHLI